MRIGFIFTRTTAGWDDRTLETGLGGTEAAMVLYAREFARRGHEVWCFVPQAEEGVHHGVHWSGALERFQKGPWDAAVSFRWPGDLSGVRAPIRALFANDQSCESLPEAVFRGWCNEVITISAYQTGLYRRLYPSIPPPLYFTTSAGVADMPEPVAHEGLRCIYSSTPERGLERLLRLWPDIHAATGAELAITSGFQLYGWDQATCDRHSAHIYAQAKGSAHYVGPLTRSAYLELLAGSDVLTYPSVYAENCCIAALEAAAVGLPIVTTPVGALRERVVDGVTGYLVKSDAEFVEKSVTLLTCNDLRRTMGQEARNLAAPHHYRNLCPEWEQRWTS